MRTPPRNGDVLIYEHRKTDPIVFDASTDKKAAQAFLDLFEHIDTVWEFYDEMEDDQRTLYAAAKKGDALAARRLLELRDRMGYEYEGFRWAYFHKRPE